MDHLTVAQLLGNYGEFVGAAAVLMTLVYLARQIGVANRNSQETSIREFQHQVTSLQRMFIGDPETTALWRKSLTSWDDLDKTDQAQAHCIWIEHMSQLHAGYQLKKRNVLPDEVYHPYETGILSFLVTPGGAKYWRIASQSYPSEFVTHLNTRIESEELRPVSEFNPWWIDKGIAEA